MGWFGRPPRTNNMQEQFSPARLFITLLVLTFCVEGVIMLSLDYVVPKDASPLVHAAVDASLMTAATSVLVWWLFMRPLKFALMGEAAQAKAIMDTAAEAIITINERGIIMSFNRAAEHMFVYEARETIGRNVKILMSEPYADKHDGYLASHASTGKGRIFGQPRELLALRKDGTEFPIEINVAEIRLGGKRRFTAIIRDITRYKQSEERLQRLAHYDSLTDLPNRVLFYDRLSQAISLAKRDHYEMALLYLDLDEFKAVNDTLGHDAGDELLKNAARRIRQQMRESDTVARIGGDEFTVILPKIAGRQDAEKAARGIIRTLSAKFCLSGHEQEVGIGASVGIAIYPTDAQDVDAFVKAADAAMYNAKMAGSGLWFFGT